MRGLRWLVALAAVLLLAVPSEAADEDAIRVPTTWLTHAQFSAAGNHAPGDLLASWKAEGGAALSTTPPPGTAAVPGGVALQYGTVEVGGRRLLVALGLEGDQGGVLAVDLDGDRSLRGEREILRKQGHLGKHGGAPVLKWKFPKQMLGQMELELQFRQLFGCHNGFMLTPGGNHALTLADAPPAGTQAVTGATSVKYGAITGTQGATSVAFVRGEGDRLTVFVDLNRNGVLGEGGEIFPAPVQRRESNSTAWVVAGITFEGTAVQFAFREVNPEAQVTWRAKAAGARRGIVSRANTSYQLHLLDADFDGTFTSAGDWWWFGPTSALTSRNTLSPENMLEVAQPFRHEAPWRLISVGADGHAVLMKDAAAPHPHEYLHHRTEEVNRTRYFPSFARDAQFVPKQGIDPNRPKAAAVPMWIHDVGIQEGLRRAKAENKPLLVDFEADWCNICKRWDYHVYDDQEVAALLSRFVLVKINVDFSFSQDVVRFGGENPPFLVFLDASANPLLQFPFVDQHGQEVRKANGLNHFQRPADFAATLKAALQAWQARQGR